MQVLWYLLFYLAETCQTSKLQLCSSLMEAFSQLASKSLVNMRLEMWGTEWIRIASDWLHVHSDHFHP